MTTRDTHDHLNQLYGIDISPSFTLLEEEPVYKEGITPDIAGQIAASSQLFDTVRLAEKRFPKNSKKAAGSICPNSLLGVNFLLYLNIILLHPQSLTLNQHLLHSKFRLCFSKRNLGCFICLFVHFSQ
ncbi:MAG: hypothetical protein ACQEXV_24950 [Bacillota bacterium]